jgi:excinuclease UvrABC nuclease subunit
MIYASVVVMSESIFKIGYIYGLYLTTEDQLVYVGQTVNPTTRLAGHNYNKKSGKIGQYKRLNPSVVFKSVIIETIMILNPFILNEREKYWITKLQPHFNTTWRS